MGDVARTELGAFTQDVETRLTRRPAQLIAIYLSPGANALGVARDVQDAMGRLAARFPAGMAHAVTYDTTEFVHATIQVVIAPWSRPSSWWSRSCSSSSARSAPR